MRSPLLSLTLVLLLAAPASAQDTYTTSTCRGPDGRPASTAGWSPDGEAPMVKADRCAAGDALVIGPSIGESGRSKANWVFNAPSSTRIVGFSLWRTARPGTGWNYSLFRDIDSEVTGTFVERCWSLDACRGVGDGTISNASRVAQTAIDTAAIIAFTDCNPAPCATGTAPDGMVRILRGDFTLRDLVDPALTGTPSGDLLDTQQPLTGVRSTSFSASDQGGGVYQAILFADGTPVASTIIDRNGGDCVPPFKGAVPCKPSASGTLSFDTATLADGAHAFRLEITDPTGTNSVSYGPVQVRTQNETAECDPTVGSSATPVSAGVKGSRRSAVTRRSGRGTITGRIAGAGAGVVVNLLSRERRTGAKAVVAATATTDATGAYSLPVAAGPSRRLRAGWRRSAGSRFVVCSRALDIRVPARATLKAKPRAVRAGSRVRLTGRLLGGRVPARGKLIDLQARELGRWRTFATVRTRASGAFTMRYRFRSSAPRKTYPMRVRVRPDAAYPFAVGYSRAVRVRVR
jgi:hypothetical protein